MKRCFFVVFSIALCVRLLVWYAPERSNEEITRCIDCGDYVQIAKNLANHGVFSRYEQPPYESLADRTPLYPLLIAFALKITPSTNAALNLIVVGQLLAGALTAGLCALIAYRLTHLLKWAWVAGILVGLEPYGIRYGLQAWTEPYFTFLLVLSTYLVLKHLQSEHPLTPSLVAAAVCFGLAALTRPVGHQVALVAVPVCLLLQSRFPLRDRFFRGVLPFLVAYSLTIAPWVARNGVLFGMWNLSCGGTVAKFMTAAKINAALDDTSRVPTPGEMNQAETELLSAWLPEFKKTHSVDLELTPENCTYWKFPDGITKPWMQFLSDRSTPVLFDNLGIYVKNSVAMCVHMTFGFNKNALCDVLNVPPSSQRTSAAIQALLGGQVQAGFRQLGSIRFIDWVGLFWSGFYALLVPTFAVVGVWCLVRQRHFSIAALLVIGILLLIVLAGFAVSFSYQSSRYIMPVKPFLVIVGVVGLSFIIERIRTAREPQKAARDAAEKM